MIAILMCTYNGAQYLADQIESILNQSIKDFKLYISDDGSTDNTIQIIEEYEKKYPSQVKQISLDQKHNGACMHFLKALKNKEIMSADYVMLSDQDDIWHANKIEVTLSQMKQLEDKNGKDRPLLVYCDSELVNDDGIIVAPSFMGFANYNANKTTFSHILIQNTVTGAASMFNRALCELLEETPDKCMMHDHWIALIATGLGDVSYIDKQLYSYRQHGDNVLGANKGGIYEEVIGFWGKREGKRKKREEVRRQVRENYQRMIDQAGIFKEFFFDDLDLSKQKTISAFVNISEKGPFARVWTLLKYNIVCDNWYRVIGQCLFFFRTSFS
ncbi:glycosyltransferase family 2 protein [Butyrivibrio sp. AE3004]|uniref:glycosyltransferase family 2 protein n=1 Tax=Butyrivibrio sp. AE3004 TaxID=1506994 RepID=UPI000493E24B|nr:glycosyltransferase family 2 protein [Butyrivibrio sp. AE3004]